MSEAAIAAALGIRLGTVRKDIRRLYEKLSVSSRAGLICRIARKHNDVVQRQTPREAVDSMGYIDKVRHRGETDSDGRPWWVCVLDASTVGGGFHGRLGR